MQQLLDNSVALAPATQISDSHSSDRLDLLYGSPDPSKNRAIQRARTMAPDELRSKGYHDGINSMMTGSLCNNPNYLQGYNEGYNSRPSAA